MIVIRKILKWILIIVLIPVAYLLVSLILTLIPVNNEPGNSEKNKSIYLNSNGVHLNIIIPKSQIDSTLLAGLEYDENDQYFAFGWGDRNFYLETQTWNDLTFKNAFVALFFKNPTLIHLTRYSSIRGDWAKISVDQIQLKKINQYIFDSFYIDSYNIKVLLPDKGYSINDDFYEASGSYSLFKTCNSWVNTGFKNAGIKACLWTPFEFGLLKLHKN
jgi:uncharacterized protein (TIGR02117 family)